MLTYGPDQAGDAPLDDAHVARVIARAARAILVRVPLALGSAGVFVALALHSRGPVVALWHLGFSASLFMLFWTVLSYVLHRRAVARIAGDLPRARALNLAPRRFWQAHGTVFPLPLIGG